MINNINAYAKCKNCDRINGNYNIKGTKTIKMRYQQWQQIYTSIQSTSAQKHMKTITLQDFVDLA